jgi:hypothetical protein
MGKPAASFWVEPMTFAVRCRGNYVMELVMGRYLLLWMLGVPIPILLLVWIFGGLN